MIGAVLRITPGGVPTVSTSAEGHVDSASRPRALAAIRSVAQGGTNGGPPALLRLGHQRDLYVVSGIEVRLRRLLNRVGRKRRDGRSKAVNPDTRRGALRVAA